MKHLSTLFLLVFLITASFAQKMHQPSCNVYLRDDEFELAIECIQKCLKSTTGRCGKDFEGKNFDAGVIYFRVFSDEDEDLNQIDTNAFDKSILYFYTSLLYNIKGADCHKLDYKINNEKSIIIGLLKNPEIEYWVKYHKSQIFDYYLPEIEIYVKDHKISDDSNEILEILRAFKE